MRLVIHSKDVEVIAGCTPRTARHILAQVRKQFNKSKHQYVTIEEFCIYKGLAVDQVAARLSNR